MTPREEAERMAREIVEQTTTTKEAVSLGWRDTQVRLVSAFTDALTPILIKNEQANELIRVLTVDRDATQEAFEKMGARVITLEAQLRQANCKTCDGRGTVDDAEFGDTAWDTYPCPDCSPATEAGT